jgi:hypothetical protein
LFGSLKQLAKTADFAALHALVEGEIGEITGIGALTVYDIAHRIGAHFGKAPRPAYLHAGIRKGARVFNISGDSFDPRILPKAFSRLAPYEIETASVFTKMSSAVVIPIATPGEVLQGGHCAAWSDFGVLFLSPIKYIIAFKTLRPPD